jgi:hypothetical protein
VARAGAAPRKAEGESHVDESDLEELSEFIEKIGRGGRVPEVAPLTDEEYEAIRALDDRRPFYERALESRRRSDEWREARERRLRLAVIPGGDPPKSAS